MLWEAKVKYGRESAAARVLEVVADEAEDAWFVVVGDPVVADPPITPATICDEPCLGACCRRNCKAFARAFSCVRTKWARFYREIFISRWTGQSGKRLGITTYLYEELPILTVHHYCGYMRSM